MVGGILKLILLVSELARVKFFFSTTRKSQDFPVSKLSILNKIYNYIQNWQESNQPLSQRETELKCIWKKLRLPCYSSRRGGSGKSVRASKTLLELKKFQN